MIDVINQAMLGSCLDFSLLLHITVNYLASLNEIESIS